MTAPTWHSQLRLPRTWTWEDESPTYPVVSDKPCKGERKKEPLDTLVDHLPHSFPLSLEPDQRPLRAAAGCSLR